MSDTRRVSDIQWFQEAYGAVTQTVRVVATEESRQQRGWVFTPGELLTASAPGLSMQAGWPSLTRLPTPTFSVFRCLPGRLGGVSRGL